MVCKPSTLEAQRGVKIGASLVGGEAGGVGGSWRHLFKTRKYQHALILSCSDVKCSRGVSAVGGNAVGGSAVGGSAVEVISENEDPTV